MLEDEEEFCCDGALLSPAAYWKEEKRRYARWRQVEFLDSCLEACVSVGKEEELS